MKQIFEVGQLVKKGNLLCRVISYDNTTGKCRVCLEEEGHVWSAMWVEQHRLKPIF